MVQANSLVAKGEWKAARECSERALEAAPVVAGKVNGQPFEWIADADSRLGPILEAMIDGRYYWVPFSRGFKKLLIEPPQICAISSGRPAHFIGRTAAIPPVSSPRAIPARSAPRTVR